jgi:hypothetical protein
MMVILMKVVMKGGINEKTLVLKITGFSNIE